MDNTPRNLKYKNLIAKYKTKLHIDVYGLFVQNKNFDEKRLGDNCGSNSGCDNFRNADCEEDIIELAAENEDVYPRVRGSTGIHH